MGFAYISPTMHVYVKGWRTMDVPKGWADRPRPLATGNGRKGLFFKMHEARCEHIAIENPIPLAVVGLPQPTTVIEPFEFGEPFSKKTCLWLKNLPPLMPTAIYAFHKPFLPSNTGGKSRGQRWSRGVAHTAKDASKTFDGIAKAMAEQWSEYIGKLLKIFKSKTQKQYGKEFFYKFAASKHVCGTGRCFWAAFFVSSSLE